MSKFLSTHTLKTGTFTREQFEQLTQAAQRDPVIRGFRGFVNLSEGKAAFVLEATNKEDVAAWFKLMKIPCDSINRVELEGYGGVINEL
jgi:hypothetical protein